MPAREHARDSIGATGRKHRKISLMNSDFTATADPNSLFAEWLREAEASEPNDPNAMALATVDSDGMPNVRMVLLKGHDAGGLRLLHELRERQGRGTGRQSAGGAALPLEEPQAAGARARHHLAWSATPRPTPISPAGRAPAGSAPGRASSRARWNRVSRWRRRSPSMPPNIRSATVPRPPYWSGYPPDAGGVGVLEGHALPPAQPRPIPPRRRRLGDGAALSVAAAAVPLSRATRPAWRPLPDARPSSPGW